MTGKRVSSQPELVLGYNEMLKQDAETSSA